MSMVSSAKTRLQFDFLPDALAKLNNLVIASGAQTKAGVIRNALGLYEWFVNEVKPDYTITVTDPDGNVVSTFKGSLLRR